MNNTTSTSPDGHYFQPIVIYKKTIRVGFHKEPLAYPIYCPLIFSEPAFATKYLSIFIKELVANETIPSDAITNDGQINESVIDTAVQEIIASTLEKIDEEVEE